MKRFRFDLDAGNPAGPRNGMTHAWLVAACAGLLSACSLPGWQLHSADTSRWYAGADPRHPDVEVSERDYRPVVHKITPALIGNLQREYASGGVAGMDIDLPPTTDDNDEYRVGAGDLLGVIVYGHPDLTNPAGTTQSVESSGRLVDSDGEIYVPFIGSLKVGGLTVDQIRKEITQGLSHVIREPQVDVKVLQYRSQKVYIAGDISRPCAVPIRDIPLTVIQALDACQSLQSERDPGTTGVNAVQLVRGYDIYPLNLSRLYRQGGDPVRLRDGDRLIVDDSFNRIFIIGEFSEQTAAPYSAGGMTLFDAIAAGGGLNLATADAGGIYVIRGFVDKDSDPDTGIETNVRPHVYHLDASSVDALILADQFQLQPRDVIYAAPASLVNFNRALAQITPSLNVLFQSFLIYDRSRDN